MWYSRRRFPIQARRHTSPRPRHARSRRQRVAPGLELLESRWLLATFTVTDTADNGSNSNPTPGSLRAAIVDSNQATPGPNNIVFAIDASTAAEDNVPVAGFDPDTQTWTITPDGVLPTITTPVDIDGFTEANVGVPYLYPDEISSASQTLQVGGATGGTFTLTTASPLPAGTTSAIPYDATADEVQAALAAIIGANNVSVTGGPLGSSDVVIDFQGDYGEEAIPDLVADGSNLTGTNGPTVEVATSVVGGVVGTPTEITTTTNTEQAIDGNNAQVRIIIDGSDASGATGFVIDTSGSMLRGLIIEGFSVGVDIPDSIDVGDSIQGDFIGDYLLYPVDPNTGDALPSPDGEEIVRTGNSQQGLIINGANTTLGGACAAGR